MGDRKKLLDELNDLIKAKETEASEKKAPKPRKPKPTRAAISRENGAKSPGPITPEGKQRVSANSLKHGFFANVDKLNPQDAPVYQRLHQELSYGLLPYGAVEELMVRELAMLSARLQRLEAAEYALICSEIDAPPEPKSSTKPDDPLAEDPQEIDSRHIAAAFLNTQDSLDRLHKIEVHLRRAYNRTWDRLRAMQKERKKLTPQEVSKQTHAWISAQQERRKPESDLFDIPPIRDKNGDPPNDRSPEPRNLPDPPPNLSRKEPQSD